MTLRQNKKVLLHKCKRHTAHSIAVASACLSDSGGYPVSGQGYPIPGLGGYPIPGPGGTLSQVWGYPIPGPGRYSIPGLGGTPSQVGGTPSHGVPPPARPGMGYPPSRPGMGYSPWPDLGWGTPLPRPEMGYPPQVWTDKQTENSTFPHPLGVGSKDTPISTRKYQWENQSG